VTATSGSVITSPISATQPTVDAAPIDLLDRAEHSVETPNAMAAPLPAKIASIGSSAHDGGSVLVQ
jgi:hypothetical protein